MSKVSVLIPSRNEPFLNRTVNDALSKATGDIEVVVLLDGAPSVEPLPSDSHIVVLHNERPMGLGYASLAMAKVATGKFIMKLDAHCLLAKGYDEVMQADCEFDWLSIPARYQLKSDIWARGYGPIHYLYLTYPWIGEPQFGAGLHGKKWLGESGLEGHYFWKEKQLRHLPIDDIMTFQGSCWFMHRDRFLELGGINERYFLWQEATDIGMKTWLSGGRVVINKKTWYAHLHKGEKHGRGYYLSKSNCTAGNMYSADYWMNDRWPQAIRNIRWFVEYFWPIPGWPDDWDNPKYQQNFVYPTAGR